MIHILKGIILLDVLKIWINIILDIRPFIKFLLLFVRPIHKYKSLYEYMLK